MKGTLKEFNDFLDIKEEIDNLQKKNKKRFLKNIQKREETIDINRIIDKKLDILFGKFN